MACRHRSPERQSVGGVSDFADFAGERILLISYYFPPIGGPHSVRWASLVSSLVQAGLYVEVLTIQPAAGYTSLDVSLLDELPQTVRIHRVSPGPLHAFRYNSPATPYLGHTGDQATSPSHGRWRQSLVHRLKQQAVRLAQALLVPDLMVEWVPSAVRTGQRVLAEKPFDLIISSAHPVCDHLVGYFLSCQADLPLICHYSDPWLFYANRKVSWPRHMLEKWTETIILRNTEQLLVPTPEAKAGFLEAFPFLSPETISLVPAGADMDRYTASQAVARSLNHFRLVYTGTFYDHIREPFAFYAALELLADLDLDIVWAGNIQAQHRQATPRARSARSAESARSARSVSGRVTYLDYQAREDCIALQKSADVLLFFGNKSATQLPSKLFEYFAAARPILSIDPVPETHASELIEKYQRGVSTADEPHAIASAVRRLYEIWQTGQLEHSFSVSETLPFSWQESGQACVQAVLKTLERRRDKE